MARTKLAAAAFVLGTIGWLGEAQAQTDWVVDSTFSVQMFEPAPGPNNFINVEGTRIGNDFALTGGVIFNYQWQPFSLYACKPGTGNPGEPDCELESEPRARIIEHMVAGDALFSVSLFKLFTAGIAVPFTMWQTGDQLNIDSGTPSGNDLPGMGGLGDLRLHLKFRFYPFMEGDKEGFGLALAPVVTFPIGQFFDDVPDADSDQTGSFMGSSQVGVNPRLIFDYYMYPFHVAAQVGYRWGEAAKFYDRTIEHRITYGGAFGFFPMPELELLAEVYGWNGMTTRVDQSPVELDVGVKYHFWDGLMLVGGVGHGFVGIGAPQVRAYLGLAYEPIEEPVVESPDRDGDTILNENDACPDDAEDLDEYQDEDGCPEPDNDNDGVLDIYDACVMVPEDVDGYKDEDGCPDLDHDEDGIDTPTDQCPEEPEDFDLYADEDGCPDLDNDGDTIPDEADMCTEEPEDFDGFDDDDGCPDLDNDRDGIPDSSDQCMDEPETLNGFEDEDGCPDRGSTLVVVTETQIEIKQQINFATDSDRIIGQRSFDVLNVVALVLRANTNVRVEIQGHTDDRGNRDHNMDLSQRRAESVRAYLMEQGVDGARLVPKGYGPDVPIESNRSAAGRAANRRVEFHIIGSGSQYMPGPSPDEGASDEGAADGGAADEGATDAGGDMSFE